MSKILLVTLVVFSFGCASRRMLTENNAVIKKGVAKVWANWVKDKGEKFDIQLAIENLSDKGIIVKLHDIQCARGKRTGRIKHTFFNTGERTIDFLSGEIKTFNLVCLMGAKASGPFNIRIAKVYSNPSNDGATSDQVIAENIIWSLNE